MDITAHPKKTFDFDVVVIGGGTTAVCAALAAAEADPALKVAIIEKNGFFGGTAALGLPWMAFHNREGKRVIGGIPYRIAEIMRKENHAEPIIPDPICLSVAMMNPDYLRITLYRLLREAGVYTALHTMAVQAVKDENGRITGVLTASREGNVLFNCGCVVDASDSGSFSVQSGVDYTRGRVGDNKVQVSSCMNRVGNVDPEPFMSYLLAHPDQIRPFSLSQKELDCFIENIRKSKIFVMGSFTELIAKARAEGVKYPRDKMIGVANMNIGELMLVSSRIENVDMNNIKSLSDAEYEGMEQTEAIVELLNRYIPGCEKAHLIGSGNQIGVRETIHIDGEYHLTGEELMLGKEFDDRIAIGAYHLDIHSPDHIGIETRKPPTYQIPYRSLIPKKVGGLILAGRIISADQAAQASFRVIPILGAIGQAAGCAAAISCADKLEPRALDIKKLQKLLISQGALLEPMEETKC